MKIDLTLEQAQSDYPNEVDQVVKELRASRSKSKGAGIEKLQFSISWSERVQSMSVGDLFSGNTPKQFPLEERVFATLQGSVGRWAGYSERIQPCPKEIIALNEKHDKERLTEQARFNALDTEEQEQETEDLLSQLRSDPGFIEIKGR